jgi:hypothetical protein
LDNVIDDEENVKKISFIFKIKKDLLKYLEKESTNFILNENNNQNKNGENYKLYKKIKTSDLPHFIQTTDNVNIDYPNPLNNTYKLKNLVFNSLYCDENILQNPDVLVNTNNNIYTFTFPRKIKDVIGIKLKAVQYPNVQYTVSVQHNNNKLYINVNGTGIQGLVTIPYGKYFYQEIASVLQKNINSTLYPNKPANYTVFLVSFDPYTTTYTISNTKKQNFTIYFDIPQFYENPQEIINNCGYIPYNNLNGFYKDYDNVNNVIQIYSLGYLLGFRQKVFSGNYTYTATSGLQISDLEEYYYFNLNDYNLSRVDDIAAVLGKSFQQKDILGVIPVVANETNNFFGNIILDTGANYIFRSRNYTGPVDIQKIQVSYYSPDFSLLNLSDNNFMFIIEFKILYDNSIFNKKKDLKDAFQS